MGFDINRIFQPSTGVDVVFNMDSLTPYSRSSIIYDVDYDNKTITIAQPHIPFSKNTNFKQLHLTTIIHGKNRRARLGIECIEFKVIDQYALANKTNVPAVLLRYKSPVKETNIRSAYRLPLSTKYILKGKILYDNLEYNTPRDFSIHNISLTGLGLAIPKKRNNRINPLTQIKTGTQIIIGIVLINMDLDNPVGTLPIKAQAIRINNNYSETHSVLGLKILSLESDNEGLLNRFIHDAQIDELKKLSKINL